MPLEPDIGKTVENNFSYHSPDGDKIDKYQSIRDKCKELAYLLHDVCPNSREKSVALTNLETTMFWANAAIARNEATLKINEKAFLSK